MVQVNLYEAKTHLSRLVAQAEAGEDVVIARAGRPAVRLVVVPDVRPAPRLGMWRGRVHRSEDFDEPLPSQLWASPVEPGADDEGPGERDVPAVP